ncbi:hypothetical protein [Roseofilum casamattae]|uniref:Uncharacterized protein n=1 Tax=Roseofilum casamattae BLCC-M143 TaxID=3022442 RepID=A0ABT7C2Y6_9CYAN|nr:hypothetical protein [Roseofilum casamattae]MDJ1184898.1 hypothetical protein [Roseofilum casamattae BLCC-M143]
MSFRVALKCVLGCGTVILFSVSGAIATFLPTVLKAFSKFDNLNVSPGSAFFILEILPFTQFSL